MTSESPNTKMPEDTQVGGQHYRLKDYTQQHWRYTWQRGFDQFQYNITKRVERWRHKGGLQDLYKTRQELDEYIRNIEAGDDPFMPEWGYGPKPAAWAEGLQEKAPPAEPAGPTLGNGGIPSPFNVG